MITTKELLKILEKACKETGSQRKWALDNGFSPAYINDVLRGNRGISEGIAEKLGYTPNVKCWILKNKKKPAQHVKYDDN
jgi:hypothetical protein